MRKMSEEVMLESENETNDANVDAETDSLTQEIDDIVGDLASHYAKKELDKNGEEEEKEVAEEVVEEKIEEKEEREPTEKVVEDKVEDKSAEEEEVKEDEKDVQISKLTSTIEKMQDRIQELVDKIDGDKSKEGGEEEAGEEERNEVVDESVAKFFDEDDTIMDVTPAKLNKAFKDVYDAAVSSITQRLPGTIQNILSQTIEIRDTVNDFFSENPELAPHKKYLQHVAREVTSEKPEISLQEMLEEAGNRVRSDLGIKKGEEETRPERKPIATRSPGSRGAPTLRKPKKEEKDPLLMEIDDLIE